MTCGPAVKENRMAPCNRIQPVLFLYVAFIEVLGKSKAIEYNPANGRQLNILPHSVCIHYSSFENNKQTFNCANSKVFKYFDSD